MSLKWVTKNSGTVHYCFDSESDMVIGRIHENYNDICTAYFKNENQEDEIFGEFVSLKGAKSAIEKIGVKL